MMIEQNTNYAYKLKYMDNPTFDKVRDLSTKFYRELPQALQDELFEALNRGIDILDSEPQMTAYLFAFGKMHQAKLEYAFSKLPEEFLEEPEINIIDYGCGQALGTMCYADFLRNKGCTQKVKTITMIEPSEICLKRATLHASVVFPNAEIKTVNKNFDGLTQDDIVCNEETPTLHILSNVLDMLNFNLERFAELIKGCLKGFYQFVCVGPYFKDTIKDQRMHRFAEYISSETLYETFDKRELNPEKDWTCVVLLCSNNKRNVIEIDCDKVFEEAKSFCENNDKDLDSDYCKELFHKLQICARFGDTKCQNLLGICYKEGIGTEQNYIAALEWYRKAADQGFGAAYSNLAWMYKNGKGVEKDEKKAFEQYLSGAHYNHSHCQWQLGNCYIRGIGIEPDYNQAFFWYNKSAAQDYAPAFNSLAICFHKGYGVEKNIERTIHFLTKAAQADNITAIKNLIKLFKKREGIEYFNDEQYYIFVMAAQKGLKDVLPIFSLDCFPAPIKMKLIDSAYSYENTYSLLLKTIKENRERDEEQVYVYELSEINNANFVFLPLNHLSLQTNKSLGFYARYRHDHELKDEYYERPPWNSLYPCVHDSNVHIKDIIIKNNDSSPSQFITAPICGESFWEIFLLDNLEDFLPKWDHGNYSIRHLVLSQKSVDGLPDEIRQYLQENSTALVPNIDMVYGNLIRIQCVYYNAWEGLIRCSDYYMFQKISDEKMKVTRLNSISNQTNVLYKYDCGIRF